MSGKRSRGAKSMVFKAWLSALPGAKGEKNYISVTSSLLHSPKYHAISLSARYIFQCMALEARGREEFYFPEATASKCYEIPPATLRKAVRELIENGIISYASVYRERGKPVPYRFNPLAWRTDVADQTAPNTPSAPKPP